MSLESHDLVPEAYDTCLQSDIDHTKFVIKLLKDMKKLYDIVIDARETGEWIDEHELMFKAYVDGDCLNIHNLIINYERELRNMNEDMKELKEVLMPMDKEKRMKALQALSFIHATIV